MVCFFGFFFVVVWMDMWLSRGAMEVSEERTTVMRLEKQTCTSKYEVN